MRLQLNQVKYQFLVSLLFMTNKEKGSFEGNPFGAIQCVSVKGKIICNLAYSEQTTKQVVPYIK